MHLLEWVEEVGDGDGDVAQGPRLARAVEQVHVALRRRVELDHAAHVVPALRCGEKEREQIDMGEGELVQVTQQCSVFCGCLTKIKIKKFS